MAMTMYPKCGAPCNHQLLFYRLTHHK